MFFFFDKYNTELHKALELPGIKQIAEQEEFYYQKAKDKFDEFLVFDVADISLPCKTRLDTKGDIAWWNIPFTGRYVNSGEHFEWSIRNELYEALIQSDDYIK